MKTLRCGIIGCGVIAPSHIESFQQQPGVEVKWVCDIELAKAEKRASEYNIPCITADYHEVLNDPEVDCIAVCTEHGSHARIAVDALDSKKHVLCEKALGRSNECIEEMLAAHERNPELIFGGIFQHRHEPINRELKKLIDEGVFGTITTVNLNCCCLRTDEYYRTDAWRGTWKHEGGAVLINQAIHFLDLVNWLFGGVAELTARCDNMTHQGVIETEDTAVIALKFKTGTLGAITATTSSAALWRNMISISGTEGYMEYMNMDAVHMEFNDPDKQREVKERLAHCKIDDALQKDKGYYGGGHPGQIRDFVEAIRENRAPFITGQSASETVKIVMACYESSRTGQWVKLD
jgi:UDP-N-acetyl-2-amino-2-deoxyglucuronate dehydrogenase